jgi:hypothetical protein
MGKHSIETLRDFVGKTVRLSDRCVPGFYREGVCVDVFEKEKSPDTLLALKYYGNKITGRHPRLLGAIPNHRLVVRVGDGYVVWPLLGSTRLEVP